MNPLETMAALLDGLQGEEREALLAILRRAPARPTEPPEPSARTPLPLSRQSGSGIKVTVRRGGVL